MQIFVGDVGLGRRAEAQPRFAQSDCLDVRRNKGGCLKEEGMACGAENVEQIVWSPAVFGEENNEVYYTATE